MGLLHEDQRDIFISYAHADQLFAEVGKHARGWVTAFAGNLEAVLNRALAKEIRTGGRELDLFWDCALMGDEPLGDELQDEVQGAGIFLALVSDQYLLSDWCRKEYDWFTGVMQTPPAGVDGSLPKTGRRPLFVIELEPVNVPLWPGLEQALREPFFHQIDKDKPEEIGSRFAYPSPDKLAEVKHDYYLGIQKLAGRIAKRLQEFVTPAPTPVELFWDRSPIIEVSEAPETVPGGADVVLAAASERLASEAAKVADGFAARGIQATVLDKIPFERLDGHLATLLGDCRAFVQLLDGAEETVSSITAMSRTMMQARAADKHEVESYFWLAPAHDKDRLIAEAEDYGSFWSRIADRISQEPDPGALVERVCEGFADDTTEPDFPWAPSGPAVDFYVSVSKEDQEIADRMKRELQTLANGGSAFRCFFPMNTDDPSAYYDDWKANVLHSDAIILIHGSAKRDWIRDQLIQIAQVMSESPDAARRKNLKIAILDAPPPPPINVVFAGIDVLDCTDGIDSGLLSDFISGLAEAKAGAAQ